MSQRAEVHHSSEEDDGFALLPQNQCPAAAESAVIGFSHPIKGQGEQNLLIIIFLVKMKVHGDLTSSSSPSPSSAVFAFVVLKQNVVSSQSDVTRQLKDSVSDKIAKYAVPDHIQVTRTPLQRSPGVKDLRLYLKLSGGSLSSGCRRLARGRSCVGC